MEGFSLGLRERDGPHLGTLTLAQLPDLARGREGKEVCETPTMCRALAGLCPCLTAFTPTLHSQNPVDVSASGRPWSSWRETEAGLNPGPAPWSQKAQSQWVL